MRKIVHLRALCAVALLLAGTCFGEDAAPQKFYKLEFVVKEVEGGKALNARSYWATVGTEPGPGTVCAIRTGSKVPIPTGPSAREYQYYDLGVNLDLRAVKEVGGELTLSISADVSSTLQESATATAPTLPPVVRQNKWTSTVRVPLRKPTVIFSSDDATGKHQMQLELTATPIT